MYETTVHLSIGGRACQPIGPVPFFHKGSLQMAWMEEVSKRLDERNRQLPSDQQIEFSFSSALGTQPKERLNVDQVMELVEARRQELLKTFAFRSGTSE